MFESEINWLREELNKHNYNYYVLNKPTVSDKEYDDMMRRLQDLEAAHKELFDPLSPSQRVGSDLTPGFRQVAHERPMLSLSTLAQSRRLKTSCGAQSSSWAVARSRL